jgi:hypothetical protein
VLELCSIKLGGQPVAEFRTTRRKLIAATAVIPFAHQSAGLAQPPGIGSKAPELKPSELDDPDAGDVMADELSRVGYMGITAEDARSRLQMDPFWATGPNRRVIPEPVWAPLADAIDYAHLVSFATPPASFRLTAATLQWLADRNSFMLGGSEPVTLFGLRGCSLDQDDKLETEWATSHNLRVDVPNHKTLKCVLGAWQRSTGKLRLFKGSTVPEAQHILASQNLAGSGAAGECNLQPTGLYEYEAGSHRAGAKFPQHGALRQPDTQPIVVLRSPDDLAFMSRSKFETWDRGWFANNIHSAARMTPKPDKPVYFSAGCQIVAGSYYLEDADSRFKPGTRPRGAWAEFRTSIGLRETPEPRSSADPDRRRRFQYMLLTGLEAALHANARPDFLARYNCIRFGSKTFSTGPVGLLQKKLGLKVDGSMGAETVWAQLKDLRSRKAFETGVVLVPPSGI